MSNYNNQEIDYSALNNISVHSSGLNSLSPYLNIDPQYLTYNEGSEFVFPNDASKKRGWGERMFSGIGMSYMTGISIGGVWGAVEGLRNTGGSTFRLRFNNVLNGCTRRGPFLANNLAVVALMYGCTNAALEKARGVEDNYNMVGSALITGILYKSTGGPRAIGIAAGVGLSLAASYYACDKLWNSRGQTWSSSQPSWE